jgi:hypothetical protein
MQNATYQKAIAKLWPSIAQVMYAASDIVFYTEGLTKGYVTVQATFEKVGVVCEKVRYWTEMLADCRPTKATTVEEWNKVEVWADIIAKAEGVVKNFIEIKILITHTMSHSEARTHEKNEAQQKASATFSNLVSLRRSICGYFGKDPDEAFKEANQERIWAMKKRPNNEPPSPTLTLKRWGFLTMEPEDFNA